MSLSSGAEVLVPRTEAAGVADAMIEAEFPIRTAHKYVHWWPEGYSGMTVTLQDAMQRLEILQDVQRAEVLLRPMLLQMAP